jgi:NAD(P)-dependent dehydrogenase (short-subunit alcohol dehydrogenase family)
MVGAGHHVAVVTGASQGIGKAVALVLSTLPGMRLALVSRRPDVLESIAAGCRENGAEATVFACDVTDAGAVAGMEGEVLATLGTPTLVVNNAGVFLPGGLQDTSADDFRTMMAVNLESAFHVSRAFAEAMVQRGSGHFVFLGSVASVRGYPGGLAYCAAKHGVLGLARTMREEFKPSGIRVTTLLPGATWTPSWDGAGIPEDRMMPADDIARTVLDVYRMEGSVVEEVLLRPQLGDL